MIRNITPIQGFGLTATKINLSLQNFQLGATSVDIAVIFLDSGGEFIAKRIVNMSGQAYANWGADDEYVINYVAGQLNLAIQ